MPRTTARESETHVKFLVLLVLLSSGCLQSQKPDFVRVMGNYTLTTHWPDFELGQYVAKITIRQPVGEPAFVAGDRDGKVRWRNREHIVVQELEPPWRISTGYMIRTPWMTDGSSEFDFRRVHSFPDSDETDDLLEPGEISARVSPPWSASVDNAWLPHVTYVHPGLSGEGDALDVWLRGSMPVGELQEGADLPHYVCSADIDQVGEHGFCLPLASAWRDKQIFRCYSYRGTGVESAIPAEVPCPEGLFPLYEVKWTKLPTAQDDGSPMPSDVIPLDEP